MIFELGNKRLKGDRKYWVSPSANVIGDVTLKNDSSVGLMLFLEETLKISL